ncbi:MAG: rhombotarget lipoprotein [Xanthomonadales bacterium]|nr:rhombotarget lipoprotein [Xanthomonadales bacterium]
MFRLIATLLASMAMFLASCSWMFVQQYRSGSSSSLVEFLYPDGEVPPPVDGHIPVIKVPARVGIAFVPGHGNLALTEAEQNQLLGQVRDAFMGRDYVERIEVIPSTYLRGKKGFDSLAQVGRLYSVDLMALVSYDQVVTTGETASSILYWTIVGAYTIRGNENEVTTFVDTAVFDLNTQRMLFRAPGLDEASKRSTAVAVGQVSRELSEGSFEVAMQQMTTNLDSELERFRERIKVDQSVRVVSRSGGEGSVDLLLLLGLCAGLLWVGRSTRQG